MTSRQQKAVKAIALFLVLVVSQILIPRNLAGPNVTAKDAVTAQVQAGQIAGKLTTRRNKPITVNGNSTKSGTTIFSGAEIQTPDGVGATVQLASLGRLDIAPNTNLTLTFSEGNIIVNLKEGYVILTTQKGITGSVRHPDGKVFGTDPSELSSVIGRTPGSASATTAASAGAGTGAGAGGTLGTAAATGTVTGGVTGLGLPSTIALISSASFAVTGSSYARARVTSFCEERGLDPSSSEPSGQCQ